jgi:hypothetical protein
MQESEKKLSEEEREFQNKVMNEIRTGIISLINRAMVKASKDSLTHRTCTVSLFLTLTFYFVDYYSQEGRFDKKVMLENIKYYACSKLSNLEEEEFIKNRLVSANHKLGV